MQIKLIDLKTFKKVAGLFVGNYKTKFHGSGIEFKDLKEYSFWDEIRSIDWLSSAKTGKMLTKKYEEEREITAIFGLDIWENMLFGIDKPKIDTLLETFLILGFSSLKNNDKIWAYFFGNKIVKKMPERKWKDNLWHIIWKIIENKELAKNTNGNSNVNVLLEELFKKRTKNSFIFILSDEFENINEKYVKILATKNNFVYINIFDEFENTLWKNWVYNFVWWNDKNLVNIKDWKRKTAYINQRKENLEKFKKMIFASSWKYLELTDKTNIYKELFMFFKKG